MTQAKSQSLGHLGLVAATLHETKLMDYIDNQLGAYY